MEDVLAQQAGGCTSPELPTAADAYAGLPYLTEVSDASWSTFYSTTASTCTVQDGGDGTRFAYASWVDTYLYDTAAFVSSPSTAQYFTPGQAELTIPIRAGAAHLRPRQQYDGAGNLTASWDDGQVDLSGAATDRPIKTVYTWEPEVGAVSALGHQYRLHRTSTVYDAGGSGSLLSAASGLDGPERRAFHQYDSLGRLHVTRVPVDGVLALERPHATLGAAGTAPEPATAAPDGADQTTTLEYDGFGNVVTQRGKSSSHGDASGRARSRWRSTGGARRRCPGCCRASRSRRRFATTTTTATRSFASSRTPSCRSTTPRPSGSSRTSRSSG